MMRPNLQWMVLVLLLTVCRNGECVLADDWPQWMGPLRDGVWRESGIVKTFPEGGPPVRWRTKIGGGYAGPAVVGNRVFVTDKQLPTGDTESGNPFARNRRQAMERVLCLSDADGSIVWK